MMIRIAGTVSDSIVDGPGFRYVIFFQGCRHCCEGCQNPATWDFNGGKLVNIDDIVKDIRKNPLITGITFSGGDPFDHPAEAIELISAIRKERPNVNIWCYTGYTFEELTNKEISEIRGSMDEYLAAQVTKNLMNRLLKKVDVLVDGPFILSQRDLTLIYRGSKNQRIIDVPESIKKKKVIEIGKGNRYEIPQEVCDC